MDLSGVCVFCSYLCFWFTYVINVFAIGVNVGMQGIPSVGATRHFYGSAGVMFFIVSWGTCIYARMYAGVCLIAVAIHAFAFAKL